MKNWRLTVVRLLIKLQRLLIACNDLIIAFAGWLNRKSQALIEQHELKAKG